MNHDGINPNVEVRVEVKDIGRIDGKKNKNKNGFNIRMIALTDINKGMELTFDYGHLYCPTNKW